MVSIISEFSLPNQIETVVSISISVIVLLFFGEIIPKQLGKIYKYSVLKIGAPLLLVFKYLFLPFTYIFTKIGSLLASIFVRKKRNNDVEFDDELQEMVDTIEDEGIIDDTRADIVRSAIEFNTTEVYEIMRPRVELKMFNINDSFNEFIKDKEYFRYSRIPIYDEEKDNVIGILPIKLLERKLLANQKIDIRSLMYKPIFVPRSMKISDVMLEFRKEKHHIAIVIDEFGGVEGAITMEDILEEIVGEIYDETDTNEISYTKTKDGYIVSGFMNIDDFFTLVQVVNDDEERSYTSVSGWCTAKLEHFAKNGDRFFYKNLEIRILQVKEYTIKKIQVIITEPQLEDFDE